jgi:hypothetical protein
MGMSYLIDTHILLWWIFDDPKLNTLIALIDSVLDCDRPSKTKASRKWVLLD